MLPSWLITFRAFALACAFAAAFVPIATYITDDKRDWLWIHIGVNIAAYIALALTTIYTTVNLTQQDHNKFSVPAYWANNVIMRTWYLGVSKTWRWHVAAAVGRLGLALAMMQHLDSLPYQNKFSIFTPHYYIGSSGAFPEWEKWLIAVSCLSIFALLETFLLSAFTIFLKYSVKSAHFGRYGAAYLRFLIISMLLSGMIAVDKTAESMVSDPSINERIIYRNELMEWYHTLFTWLDNGTMITVKVLRPAESYQCIWQTVQGGCERYADGAYMTITIIQTLAAYATYILAIIASLQLAQYLHWRREQSLITPSASTH